MTLPRDPVADPRPGDVWERSGHPVIVTWVRGRRVWLRDAVYRKGRWQRVNRRQETEWTICTLSEFSRYLRFHNRIQRAEDGGTIEWTLVLVLAIAAALVLLGV